MPLHPLSGPAPERLLASLRQARHDTLGATAARRLLAVTIASFGTWVAAQTPPPAERLTAAAAFARADTDHDGRLTRQEAARFPAFAERFDTYDTNKDGALSPEEFTVGFNAPV